MHRAQGYQVLGPGHKADDSRYTRAMACHELVQLRKQATQVKNQMDEQKKKASSMAGHTRHGRPSGKSEHVPLLQRKLNRLGDRIDRHIAKHGCQE
jgi:hypothetical protein